MAGSLGGNIPNMSAIGSVVNAQYECLLFDMDDTLYSLSSGINLACRSNIEEYMMQQLKVEESEVQKMCLELYRENGTTMAGLKALGYEFDNDDFHAFVHGRLPYGNLNPDPTLRNLLLSAPQRKIILTNADKAHGHQVLERLGLEDCFEGIICFETLNPPPAPAADTTDNAVHLQSRVLCKPSPEAFDAAFSVANINPDKTIFFDDSAGNIVTAKAKGLHTVIVGRSELVGGADYALSSIHNMKEAIPEIWEGEGEQPEQVYENSQCLRFYELLTYYMMHLHFELVVKRLELCATSFSGLKKSFNFLEDRTRSM